MEVRESESCQQVCLWLHGSLAGALNPSTTVELRRHSKPSCSSDGAQQLLQAQPWQQQIFTATPIPAMVAAESSDASGLAAVMAKPGNLSGITVAPRHYCHCDWGPVESYQTSVWGREWDSHSQISRMPNLKLEIKLNFITLKILNYSAVYIHHTYRLLRENQSHIKMKYML